MYRASFMSFTDRLFFTVCFSSFFITSNAIASDYADYSGDLAMLESFFDFTAETSIATGYDLSIKRVPATVSIISGNELRSTGVTRFEQALERVPGVHVSYESSAGSPVFSLRGIATDTNPHALFMMNGVPRTWFFQGGRGPARGGPSLPSISRIEVVRGPGSALYGADALSGVINVVTKRGSEIDKAEFGVRYGSFNSKSAWYLDGGVANSIEWMVMMEYDSQSWGDEKYHSDGQSLIDRMLVDRYGSLAPPSTSLTPLSVDPEQRRLAIDTKFNTDSLEINLGYQERLGEPLFYVAGALGDGKDDGYGVREYYADARYYFEFENGVEFTVKGSYLRNELKAEHNEGGMIYPPGSTGPTPIAVNPLQPVSTTNPLFTFDRGVIGTPECSESSSRLDFTAVYDRRNKHHMTVGAGYQYNDIFETRERKNFSYSVYHAGIMPDMLLLRPLPLPPGVTVDVADTPSVFLQETSRDSHYILVQDVWQMSNDWSLTTGVRYDYYSDFGSTVNPRIALVWAATATSTWKLLYGEAFRAPSASELYVTSNPALLGNPALDPETLESYELVYDYHGAGGSSLRATVFYYEWDNVIRYVSRGVSLARAENTAAQSGYGIEFEGVRPLTDTLSLFGSFAVMQVEDDDGNDIPGQPFEDAYVRLDWLPHHSFTLSTEANWIGAREREKSDPRGSLDGYTVFNIKATKKLKSGVDLSVVGRNLFDSDMREPFPATEEGLVAVPEDIKFGRRVFYVEAVYRF